MSEKWKTATILAIKILVVGVFVGVAGFVLYLLPKIAVIVAPFLTAIIIAWICTPISKLLERIKCPKKISAVVSFIITLLVVGGLLTLVISKLIEEVVSLATKFSSEYETLVTMLLNAKETVKSWLFLLPDEYIEYLSPFLMNAVQNLGRVVGTALTKIVQTIPKFAVNSAMSVPSVIIFVVITIFASITFVSERKNITERIKSYLPQKTKSLIKSVKSQALTALGGYVKTQLILMSITFTELLIGFLILKVDYSFILALSICIIDAIPILGTGTVLIPWGIVMFILGNVKMGIGLLLLYGVCLAIRQFCEPRVLGKQIGIHPLITLFAMYTGLKLIGFWGLIIGPILAMMIKYIIEGRKQEI